MQALLSELRQELEEEDFETGSISVSFRFSDCRVDHAFPSTASVKVRCTCIACFET